MYVRQLNYLHIGICLIDYVSKVSEYFLITNGIWLDFTISACPANLL